MPSDGLRGVVATETAISDIDVQACKLMYCGCDVKEPRNYPVLADR